MDHIKESTHNSKKTYNTCAKCFISSYSCPKCKGACIFTRPFLNKLRVSKHLQTQLTHEPYSDLIEDLRELISEDHTQHVDQESVRAAQEYSALELLEVFHEDHTQYFKIINEHRTEYGYRTQRLNRYGLLCSHTTRVKGRCNWDKAPGTGYGSLKDKSRCRKQQKIMKESTDFTLELSEMDKELNERELWFLNF